MNVQTPTRYGSLTDRVEIAPGVGAHTRTTARLAPLMRFIRPFR